MSSQVIKQIGLRSALAVAVASAMLAGCGSSSSGGGGVSGLTVNVNGGNGSLGGNGGSGGGLDIEKYTGGGMTAVRASGAVDASFGIVSIATNLGSNPLKITADTVMAASLANCAAAHPATGTTYTVSGQSRMFIATATGATCDVAEQVTGLSVDSGKKLTLALNNGGTARYYFSNDMVNNGAITAADSSVTQRGNIDLEGASYVGAAGSTIDTSATLDAQSGGNIYLWAQSVMLNQGNMNASGHDSTSANSAGSAGYIDIESNYYSLNTGNLTANGGATAVAAQSGGGSNYLEVWASRGPVYNSGKLTGNGGKGVSAGGSGASVYVENGSNSAADVHNSGVISVVGGDATGGSAGSGGYVEMYAYGGDLRNNADISNYGGSVTVSTSGSGGSGGNYNLYARAGSLSESTPPGNVYFSGNLDAHGGSALATGTGTGGGGGYIYSENNDTNIASLTYQTDLLFVGYASLSANGGSGDHGGSGGGLYVYNFDGHYNNVRVPSGSAAAEIKVTANGGDAVTGGTTTNSYGGSGGWYDVETDSWYERLPEVVATATVTGDFAGSAGKNRQYDGSWWQPGAGYSYVFGYDGVTVTQNVVANGGSDPLSSTTTSTDGRGQDGGSARYYAETGTTTVTGNATLLGGDGKYRAGSGGRAEYVGAIVSESGNVDVSAGNADPLHTASAGGNGGHVLAQSRVGGGSTAGSKTYAGGLGATKGVSGYFQNLLVCTGNCY